MSNTNNFKIVQYNIRKESSLLTSLLQDEIIKDVDVLAIQEPSWNRANQSPHNDSTSCFHLAHKGNQETRTCFYINKRINTDSWEATFHDGDLCSLRFSSTDRINAESQSEGTTDLEQRTTEHKHIWVHNVYNPSPSQYTTTDSASTLPLLQNVLMEEGEHVLMGDFNLHHPRWNNAGRYTYHAMADQLLEIIEEREMELGTPKGAVTWKARGHESTIDLTFFTKGAYQALSSCTTREDLHYGSDHFPVMTELEWSWEEAKQRPRRAWKKLEEISTRREVEQGANALSYTLRRPELATRDDIDAYLERMLKGFREIVDITIPWKRSHQNAKSYWTARCAKVTLKAKECLREYTRSRSTRTEEALKAANHEKVRVIRKAKTFSFRESVHQASLRPTGVWKLAKWGRQQSGKPKELPQFPAIQDGNGGKAKDFEGKVRALRRVLFPPSPIADLSDIAETRYPEPLEENGRLSNKEVREAIWHPAADKAPGITGIPNRFLRTVTETKLIDSISHLFQACFDVGYHPKHFKEANTIILKKPGKKDYSEPKSYRPIALLDTLGKALETVISKRLNNIAEEHKMLPAQQMGARRKRSVETALETLTEAVHTVWNHGKCGKRKVASLLSLDVAGAFDNVSHERLIHNLRSKRVPSFIVKWTESFLQERATSITLGGKTSAIEEVKTGIPQGSPISPVLFLFFNAPLIESCVKANLPVQVGGFVDDIHLLAYSESTEANCVNLEKAHNLCLKWAATHGASFAPQKYELLHMSRTPKKFNMKMAINFDNTVIEPEANIRVLGLQVDSKLRWGPHIAQLKAKSTNQGRAIKCLAGSTWGATFQKCRLVYNAVMRPMLTFAASIWHQPKGTSEATKSHIKRLAIIQNDCLRTVLGAFKATPVPVLEAEAAIAPIEIQLDRLVMQQQASGGIHLVTQEGNKHIWNKLQGKKKKKRPIPPSPAKEKEAWALRSLGVKEWHEAACTTRRKKNWINPIKDVEEYQDVKAIDQKVQDWARQQWLDRWSRYQAKISISVRSPAQEGGLFDNRFDYHSKLRKAESSMAVQLRSEKIGLNDFLYRMKVPGIRNAECSCGWRKQTVKHILLFCPELAKERRELIEQVGTSDYRQILTQKHGIRAAARWMIKIGRLDQFSLAQEQLARSKLPLGLDKETKNKKKGKEKRGSKKKA